MTSRLGHGCAVETRTQALHCDNELILFVVMSTEERRTIRGGREGGGLRRCLPPIPRLLPPGYVRRYVHTQVRTHARTYEFTHTFTRAGLQKFQGFIQQIHLALAMMASSAEKSTSLSSLPDALNSANRSSRSPTNVCSGFHPRTRLALSTLEKKCTARNGNL